MAHLSHASLRTVLLAVAAASALAGCYETSPPSGPACTTEFAPVCGDDGVTYANACLADAAGAAVAHAGPCTTGNECAVDADCDLGAICEPVYCGAPRPACVPGSPCPLPPPCPAPTCEACGGCPAIYAPVCGADGVTYGNECEARCAHVAVASTGECGTTCPRLACPPVYCEYGYVVDRAGCSTCVCNPPPACGDEPVCGLYCEFGYVQDARGCATCECNPPPECTTILCDVYCPYGNVIDERGCETCACNPAPGDLCSSDADCGPYARCDFSRPVCGGACPPGEPCPPTPCWGTCVGGSLCEPVACDLWCEFGYAIDPAGCEICACNEPPPPPPPPVRLCLDDAGCAADERCDHSVCFSAPCAPGMACPDVCYGACFGAVGVDGGVPMPR